MAVADREVGQGAAIEGQELAALANLATTSIDRTNQ